MTPDGLGPALPRRPQPLHTTLTCEKDEDDAETQSTSR